MNGQDIVIIMGLFGSDKPTKRVQNIVDEANHPSVDSEVVGKKTHQDLFNMITSVISHWLNI